MTLLPIIFLTCLWAAATATGPVYTNQWVTKIHGGEAVAQRIARDLGYTYKGQISPFVDHYLLIREDHPETAVRESSHLTRSLEDMNEVKWAEQHRILEISDKGQFQERENNNNWDEQEGSPSHQQAVWNGPAKHRLPVDPPVDPDEVGKGNFNSIPKTAFSTKPAGDSQLKSYTGVTTHVRSLSSKKSAYENVYNDPLWGAEWYVQDYRIKEMPVMDHNVVPVYMLGYTGKGVTVMFPGNGIELNHRDLVGNVDESLSYDFCSNQPGCKPDGQRDRAGTLYAGITAMVANNRKCGVGIAYQAKVAGAKIMCPESTHAEENLEAKALVHELDKVDIYANPWGIMDDGQRMPPLPQITADAMDKGLKEGRSGNGAIYLFSSGNGKNVQDNCGADSLVNYMGTIVFGGVNQFGKDSYYSERCPSIFATAYTGDVMTEMTISTTLDGDCSTGGIGAGMTVPIGAGIIALALEAKPELTYRDIMHLIAWSSEVAPLANNEDTWKINGRGLWVSNDFGFGLLNAENMVTLAKHWDKVPKQITCTKTIHETSTEFYAGEGFKIIHDAKPCQDEGDDGIHFIEQVEVTSTIKYDYRGAITVHITSPSGMRTTLLEPRMLDDSTEGLKSWSIRSVQNWGENIEGQWIVEVKIDAVRKDFTPVGSAEKIILTFHGTHDKPSHYNRARKYAAFRLPDGRTSRVQS